MMFAYRCQICGEVYLGNEPADRCPFCGAAGKNLLSPAEYIDYGKLELCEQSRNDCMQAITFEIDNVGFYDTCVKKAETQISYAIFKRLKKHELEHAEFLCKMLGINLPDAPPVQVPERDRDKFDAANEHEDRAIRFYMDVAKRAPEPRMKEIFRALAEIESEHLKLSNIYR